MPIKLKFDMSSFRVKMEKMTEAAENAIISRLTEVGLECISEARNNPGYTDQSGNLRSSIGFCIVKDGQIVEQQIVPMVKKGVDGKKAAEDTLARLASSQTSGICLIVVAGMNYAVYVEFGTKRNNYTPRNVLTSAKLLADRLVPQKLEELGLKVSKK